MKALSVKQPWAGLIGARYKTIEARSWRTNYRGDLLICSSKKPDKSVEILFLDSLCFFLGSTICIVKLVDCVPFLPEHEEKAMCTIDNGYAWILEDVRDVAIEEVKGKLSIFDLPDFSPEDLLL